MPTSTDHDVSQATPPSNASVASSTLITSESDSASTKLPEDKLDALNVLLAREVRIKEGAEKLLNLELPEHMRLKVQTELKMATLEIATLSQKIDLEDFRTALSQAQSCIQSLSGLGHSAISPPVTSLSSGTSQSANGPDVDRNRIDLQNRLGNILRRNIRVCYELDVTELLQAVTPSLADKCSTQCRTSAYRIMRLALVNVASLEEISKQPIDWYIVRTLSRDNKHEKEKEQVIKLIRAVLDVVSENRDRRGAPGTGVVPLSEPVMRAFIAVAEHAEEPLRLICIQTLAEMVLLDIDLVARTGGIRFLLHALGEGPIELAPLLAATFLHIVDSPKTRCYLRLGTDLEIALSPFTDAYGRGPDHADRMRGSAKVIQLMLRTWSGLMYFCMDQQQAIRSIVDTLRIPSMDTREIVLDFFFDLLNIQASDWYKAFIDGRRLTMYRKSRIQPSERLLPLPTNEHTPESLKLTDQYIALLVLVFTDAGLIDALTGMLEECATSSSLSRKATLLMAEVMQIANRVLPLPTASKIQAIPRVFDLASEYGRGESRIIGTSALSQIDSFNRNRGRLQTTFINGRPRANSSEEAVRRGQRQVEQAKLKANMQMDDKTFQTSLLETQVTLTKDHTKWHFDILQELIEGPFLNPKRLEEAIKVARFMKRLLSFYHPFSRRFSDLPKNSTNQRWIRLGCSLLNTLLASPEGVRYLMTEDDLLKQIVKAFMQLMPGVHLGDIEPYFSDHKMRTTLTFGYFELLGTLSKHPDGIDLMEKAKVFTALYNLTEIRGREDIMKLVIEHLDYSLDGHSRLILSKTLTTGGLNLRRFTTRHLAGMVQSSAAPVGWMLRMLVTQLYDPLPEVCQIAVQTLEEVCDDMDTLQLVVEMQPTMDHLGPIGHPLLLKFMSTSMGFRYLYDANYIQAEMESWFHERNLEYVVQVEIFLAKVFSSDVEYSADALPFDGAVPAHFYGELSKTELGCQVLEEKGHFLEFCSSIRDHALESEDVELILKLKSILWAVGSIGATARGLSFLVEAEIIPDILKIAEQSLIPSVRGTCFFVLGLISSTPQGVDILDDCGWEATLSPLGFPTGLCVPVDLDKFISMPAWDVIEPKKDARSGLLPPISQHEVEVMTVIDNLSNTVIANAASRSLAKMKSRPEYRHVFSSPATFYRALHTISNYRYRLPVRRYILDLFTLELDASLVLELAEQAIALRAPLSSTATMPKAPVRRVVSMFGPNRGYSESDDEEDESDEETEEAVDRQPVITLRPVSRLIGFDS
ncbi:hypothetical protein CONPUDRAFT_90112 [Coniophora puteana RWD-64-598 SS2]|uniref:REM-1 domain-containing protein n=1 Tax=Coniophora puteana (strain RWD-64-598) TaxID=741705 RepID=A0A5M3MQX6_CONPW|nr:uncharacterized protein CONPUDRAFT_90112 [Coniophora puteana RWD-64-598 SS2]EIW81055.1 hypothetical protein CONPUDRAFT_90112 [Coniophora puteana RWD-64-598 SS2]